MAGFLPTTGAARLRAAIAVVVVGLMMASSAPAQDSGQAKLLPDAKATDCVACHAAHDPLPSAHPPIAGKTLTDCHACHAPGSAQDLTGVMPLFHSHLLSGLTCKSCHSDPAKAEPVEASTCMGYHDPEKVAAATANVKPTNPHDSPHYGKTADCDLCHHQHEKSENYCAQCHQFNFKVP